MRTAIIGGGNMGCAFAVLCLDKRILSPAELTVIERSAERRVSLSERLSCTITDDVSAAGPADLVLLAVKPQDMAATCAVLLGALRQDAVVLSIMAGITTSALRRALHGHPKIARCMPNMPLQVGRGMSAYYATDALSDAECGRIEALFEAGGACLRLEREEQLDGATALSGSGPGYAFYFFEAFLAAAVELGFSQAEAKLLIAQTFEGACALWRGSEADPRELRLRVTSPGGTTAAAIAVFDECRVQEALRRGILRACERSRELSEGAERQ